MSSNGRSPTPIHTSEPVEVEFDDDSPTPPSGVEGHVSEIVFLRALLRLERAVGRLAKVSLVAAVISAGSLLLVAALWLWLLWPG